MREAESSRPVLVSCECGAREDAPVTCELAAHGGLCGCWSESGEWRGGRKEPAAMMVAQLEALAGWGGNLSKLRSLTHSILWRRTNGPVLPPVTQFNAPPG
jgi:hypothetical protein